jgi:hypothetical protein
MQRFSRWLGFSLLFVSLASLAPAQNPATLETRLREQITLFEKSKRKADEKAAQAFEKVINGIRKNPKLTEEIRQELLTKCYSAREQFERDRSWPVDRSLGLLDDEFDYVESLAKAFEPVSAGFERTIRAYRTANDEASAARLLAEKLDLVKSNFISRAGFANGNSWVGERTGPKGGTTPIRLNLKTVKDATFEGVIHQSPQVKGHPIYEVTGLLDGNRVIFHSSKQVQGKQLNLTFSGFLSTDRLFLYVGGKGSGGAPVNDRAILDKVEPPKKKKGKK